jgi:hypothetical protein
MSQLKHSPKKSVRIASAIAIAALVAVLGAVAVDARSRFSPLESSATVSDQAVRPAVVSMQSSDGYYFPAQFKAPEGAPAEPVDTF